MATDGFLLELQNTADSKQTFDLFSPVEGGTLLPDRYTFVWTIEFTGTDYFDPSTLLWQPGLFGWCYNGEVDPLIGTLCPSITTTAVKTKDELITLLNDGDPGIVGTWDIEVVTKPEKAEESLSPVIYLQVSVKLNIEWAQDYLDPRGYQFGSVYFEINPSGPGATLYLDKQSEDVVDYGGGVLLPQDEKIIIASGSPNFTYDQFVNSVQQRTYDVKGFDVYCEVQNQLLQPLLFDRKLATGRVYQKVLTPIIDPYQNQNYLKTPDKIGYVIDGFTSLKYSILPYACARILIHYNYIDISTPLMVQKKEPKIPQFAGESYVNQGGWTYPGSVSATFISNMTNGYEQFGCKFLAARLAIHEGTLAGLVSAGTNPQWQEMLKDKIDYINNKMQTEECNFDDIPQFSQMSELYKPRDLFVPTNDFIQHQIDIEQGAEKLLGKPDFPMDIEHNQ